MLLFIVAGQKEECLIVQELSLKTFDVLICFQHSCCRCVKLFMRPSVE